MGGVDGIIYWRTASGVILTSVFGEHADMAESRDHDGTQANHVVCRRYRPVTAIAWSRSAAGAWLDLSTCPVRWAKGERCE
jgi:hypothetical protein